MSNPTAMTIYFRGEVLPAKEGVQLRIVQEGPDHDPVAVLELGTWPLTVEAGLVLVEELMNTQRDAWVAATGLLVADMNKRESA